MDDIQAVRAELVEAKQKIKDLEAKLAQYKNLPAHREWYHNNKETLAEKKKVYRKENREKLSAYQKEYRMRKKNEAKESAENKIMTSKEST